MNEREKLLRMIRKVRARISPGVLERARRAANKKVELAARRTRERSLTDV
jgi:hypothetical protein